jgi:hypothetical protein
VPERFAFANLTGNALSASQSLCAPGSPVCSGPSWFETARHSASKMRVNALMASLLAVAV